MGGTLGMTRLARSLDKRGLLLPSISAKGAEMVEGVDVYLIDSLDRAVRLPPHAPQHPPDDILHFTPHGIEGCQTDGHHGISVTNGAV